MIFTKMHGLGNDFIMVNGTGLTQDWCSIAAKICPRRTAIGADGLIIAEPSDIADIKMRIINSDGSEAEMCGNGIRCLAKFAIEQKMVSGDEFSVETLAGIIRPKIIDHSEKITNVQVDMGQAILERGQIPMLGPEGNALNETLTVQGRTFDLSVLLVGVPHAVVFVDNLDEIDICYWGKLIENHEVFPRRTNVNFMQVLDNKTVRVRTWERGAGATLACGTGSCACAVAAYLSGKTGNMVDVELYCGKLHIEYDGNRIYMTGPAETAYTGETIL